MSEYQSVTIGDVCDVGDGAHSKVERVSKGIPYLTSKNIKQGALDTSKIDYISEDDFVRLFTVRPGTVRCPEAGDVLMGIIGTFGNFYQYKESDRFGVSSAVAILRPRQEVICPEYLGVVCSSNQFKSFHQQVKSGSVQGYTNISTIKTLPILLPPLPNQKVIAHILGTLDDKIELNRKTNETLEAMAKALFKSWFVDFDPVRAKVEGRSTGLPAEISDLFPDSFEDSELGEIPIGWEVKGLDEIAHFLNGLALQKFPPEDGVATLPVIKIAQLKKGDSTGADRCSTAVPSDYVIRDGDVLFSWSGSLAVDIWCGGDGALNQHLFKVTSKTYGKWFFYQWVNHHLSYFQEIAQGKATTMGHIQRYHLSEAKVLIPPPSILAAMDSAFTALLDRAFGLRRQSKDLASIRDSLLPKLISGEIRIPDAEKLLEEVGI